MVLGYCQIRNIGNYNLVFLGRVQRQHNDVVCDEWTYCNSLNNNRNNILFTIKKKIVWKQY